MATPITVRFLEGDEAYAECDSGELLSAAGRMMRERLAFLATAISSS
jgi:hypothetical protein